MVHKSAVVTNVRIKCHRKNCRKMGLGRIYAGSYCRTYRYYKIASTAGRHAARKLHASVRVTPKGSVPAQPRQLNHLQACARLCMPRPMITGCDMVQANRAL